MFNFHKILISVDISSLKIQLNIFMLFSLCLALKNFKKKPFLLFDWAKPSAHFFPWSSNVSRDSLKIMFFSYLIKGQK
jgi:hypothetical protein